MITKSFEKYINSLKQKKYRALYKRFIAEGEKAVIEFLKEGWKAEKIYALPEWIETAGSFDMEIVPVTGMELKRLSSLATPSSVLAVFENKDAAPDEEDIQVNHQLVLDGISDPGNMGTIIRMADWFGFKQVFCSEDCVEAFNPKVVQASMGSLARVAVFETNLLQLFQAHASLKIFGTATDGDPITGTVPPETGFFVIGSEAKGISDQLKSGMHRMFSIPRLGKAESLNAAVAAAILCAWMKKVV